MKVIFLDIDGVLNKQSDYEVYTTSDFRLNLKLLENLLQVVEETGAKLVLSSTWRLLRDGPKFLNERGLDFIGSTDNLGKCRGDEIHRWLDSHTVDRYVIVDDSSDMLNDQLENFVQTDFLTGLNKTIAYRITYKLNK